jgi:PIN domain nuclease of toxin-antitoxin system
MDTHAFLWWGEDNPKLSPLAREIISDADNSLLLSTASAWEIAIKASLNKLDNVPADLEGFLDEQLLINGFEILPVGLQHAVGIRDLPHHHNDPFDRMLIAQALSEGIPILSTDGKFGPYNVSVLW